jgi:plasmid stability protein
MTVIVTLPSELEARLRERAAQAGQAVDAFVRDAVEEKLAGELTSTPSRLTSAQKLAAYDAWIAGRQGVDHFVDDSRDSIYEGRGE